MVKSKKAIDRYVWKRPVSMRDKVLIITYVFPPYPGVGGRRWAKFSKYLAKEGCSVFVVHSKSPFSNVSTYLKDVDSPQIKTFPLPSRHPNYAPKTIWEKFKTRIALKFLEIFSRGNFYDRSILWRSYFKKQIPEIIEKNDIKKVIISGGPFHYFMFGLELQKKYSGIPFYFDYRDPWADFNVGYDDPKVGSGSRYEYEKQMEISFLKQADHIMCVSDFQKQLLASKAKSIDPDKIIVIPNGFDPEDFQHIHSSKTHEKEKGVLKIVHVGTLNYEKSDMFIPFLKAINSFNEGQHLLKVLVDFIGPVNKELTDFVHSNPASKACIRIHGELSHLEANKKLRDADIALWFKYDRSPGDFATKYYEYIFLKVFIWVLSKAGEATEFIESNTIGKAFTNKEKIEPEILDILKNYIAEPPQFNPKFNSDDYSVEKITKKISSIVFENRPL